MMSGVVASFLFIFSFLLFYYPLSTNNFFALATKQSAPAVQLEWQPVVLENQQQQIQQAGVGVGGSWSRGRLPCRNERVIVGAATADSNNSLKQQENVVFLSADNKINTPNELQLRSLVITPNSVLVMGQGAAVRFIASPPTLPPNTNTNDGMVFTSPKRLAQLQLQQNAAITTNCAIQDNYFSSSSKSQFDLDEFNTTGILNWYDWRTWSTVFVADNDSTHANFLRIDDWQPRELILLDSRRVPCGASTVRLASRDLLSGVLVFGVTARGFALAQLLVDNLTTPYSASEWRTFLHTPLGRHAFRYPVGKQVALALTNETSDHGPMFECAKRRSDEEMLEICRFIDCGRDDVRAKAAVCQGALQVSQRCCRFCGAILNIRLDHANYSVLSSIVDDIFLNTRNHNFSSLIQTSYFFEAAPTNKHHTNLTIVIVPALRNNIKSGSNYELDEFFTNILPAIRVNLSDMPSVIADKLHFSTNIRVLDSSAGGILSATRVGDEKLRWLIWCGVIAAVVVLVLSLVYRKTRRRQNESIYADMDDENDDDNDGNFVILDDIVPPNADWTANSSESTTAPNNNNNNFSIIIDSQQQNESMEMQKFTVSSSREI